jgi:hypothetical protein
MIRKSMPSGFDPMGGSRLSEEIMLKQKIERDDDSKKSHLALGSGLAGGSTVEKPKQAAQHDADQDAGHQREVEGGAAALDQNVARKAAKPNATEPRPSQPGEQHDQSKSNQKALHIHRIYRGDGTPSAGDQEAF